TFLGNVLGICSAHSIDDYIFSVCMCVCVCVCVCVWVGVCVLWFAGSCEGIFSSHLLLLFLHGEPSPSLSLSSLSPLSCSLCSVWVVFTVMGSPMLILVSLLSDGMCAVIGSLS